MSGDRKPSASLPGLSRRQRRAAARRAAKLGSLPSAAAALALSLGLQPSEAHAATFEVTNLNDSGAGSLRQAIADANANPDSDLITFQSGLSGTITLTTGELSISESLEIQGPGSDVLAISGNDSSRVFSSYRGGAAIDVTISGLKITGGHAMHGAGVNNSGEHLTLDSVEVSGNVATGYAPGSTGGGIRMTGPQATLTLRDSVISGNSADGRGGGAYLSGAQSVLIQDSEITDNQCNHASWKGAGGVMLRLYLGDVTIERSTISGNTTNGHGGGLFLYLYGGVSSIDIRQSTIASNDADAGGGIFIQSRVGAVALQNSTISGNHSTAGVGGGVYVKEADDGVEIGLSTVAANTASGAGGGISVSAGDVTVTNTLVGDNTAGSNADVNGTITANYSLIETPGSATLTGSNNITGQDPVLRILADNGGPTQTQMPALTSPAINAGDPAFASPPDKDQRGDARVVGGRVDIGALELNAGTLQCSMANVSVAEDADLIMLSVTRVGGADGDAMVDIATANGTATQPGDYTQSTTTLNWAANDMTAKTLSVPIVDDELAESDEMFTAVLSNAVGAALGATTSVTVTINDDDAAPTTSAIADQNVDEDEATPVIDFTIDDADDAASSLTVSATSSNHAVVEDAGITLGGSGANRTVKVTPKANASGSTDITITVSDGTNMGAETFTVDVGIVDDAPTISAIDDVKIDENESTGAIKFTIGDSDTDLADLVVTAKSSKHSLLADDDITLGGSGAKRTVTVKPLADKSGKVDVTITVSDGTKSSKAKFTVTVSAVTETTPDAGMMEPSDAGGVDAGGGGTSGSGGSGGSGGNGSAGKDASTGSGGEDASAAGDAGNEPLADGGADAGTGKLSGGGGDCGCSTVGASTRPSSAVIGTLLAMFGMAARRRRRTKGCPRCS